MIAYCLAKIEMGMIPRCCLPAHLFPILWTPAISVTEDRNSDGLSTRKSNVPLECCCIVLRVSLARSPGTGLPTSNRDPLQTSVSLEL